MTHDELNELASTANMAAMRAIVAEPILAGASPQEVCIILEGVIAGCILTLEKLTGTDPAAILPLLGSGVALRINLAKAAETPKPTILRP